ncbi:MAG: undecaprenyldiphospho-muramoylpentapeptide beta-N-acetylglucosaminyltransferase [Eubacteriaceae bacterium]|nr:undecaprenyldiphospho-muramoylpentapeptide beta-N-acetylglucosaminyltransferase [Eubacteriaceae bacterium]
MRVLIAAAVTGGHIYPALAIAEELKIRSDGNDTIEFIGIKGKLEDEIVVGAGYKVHHISATGFEKSSLKKRIKALLLMRKAYSDASKIIKDFAPDVVVGMGGFVTAYTVWAARRHKVPALLHEQNAYPGRAVRAAARFCDSIALSLEDAKAYFPAKQQKKIVITGNPVRREFEQYTQRAAREKLGISEEICLVLALGGSQGARNINQAVVGAATQIADDKLQFILLTGSGHYEDVKALLQEQGKQENIQLLPYSNEMPLLLNACDLVICRGGATTLFENMAAGKAGIYIPYPYAANDHQRHNIAYIVSRGGGILLEDKGLSPQNLAEAICEMISDKDRLEQMSQCAKNASPKEVLSKICKAIENLAKVERDNKQV